MGSLNRVMLIGNLGRDAELKYTPAGAAVATVNLATTDTWKDKQGQKKDATEWHRVVIWGKTAESVAEYLTKGKQIYVEGKLQTRKWKDKDGHDKYTTEIRADKVVLLSGGSRDASGPTGDRHLRDEDVATEREPGQKAEYEYHDGEDVPFSWLLPMLLAVGGMLA